VLETCLQSMSSRTYLPQTSDRINDLFVPLPYRYVKSVRIEYTYTTDGEKRVVFITTDPDVNWSGPIEWRMETCERWCFIFYVR